MLFLTLTINLNLVNTYSIYLWINYKSTALSRIEKICEIISCQILPCLALLILDCASLLFLTIIPRETKYIMFFSGNCQPTEPYRESVVLHQRASFLLKISISSNDTRRYMSKFSEVTQINSLFIFSH
jgi:hypothetical protein